MERYVCPPTYGQVGQPSKDSYILGYPLHPNKQWNENRSNAPLLLISWTVCCTRPYY